MIITSEMRDAIKQACSGRGGAKALAEKAGFTPAQLNRYYTGKTQSISEECWGRLFDFVFQFLPDGFTCQILKDGKLQQRTIKKSTAVKTQEWKDEEFLRLFGDELPTRARVESLLIEKISKYKDNIKLLYLLLDFECIMENLLKKQGDEK